jgi:hypothetical protein
MQDPSAHVSVIATLCSAVIGSISGFIAWSFDVPAPAIFAAFVGSCFGVAFSEAVTYRRALWMLLGGTIAAGFAITMFTHYFGNFPQRGVAVLLAFILVKYHKKIFEIIEYQLNRFGAGRGKANDESIS